MGAEGPCGERVLTDFFVEDLDFPVLVVSPPLATELAADVLRPADGVCSEGPEAENSAKGGGNA